MEVGAAGRNEFIFFRPRSKVFQGEVECGAAVEAWLTCAIYPRPAAWANRRCTATDCHANALEQHGAAISKPRTAVAPGRLADLLRSAARHVCEVTRSIRHGVAAAAVLAGYQRSGALPA